MDHKEQNNDEKISIKLERYRWPDELEKERKKRQHTAIIIIAVIGSFLLGFLTRSFFSGNQTLVGDNSLARFETVYYDLLDKWYFINDFDDLKETLINNAINGMLELNGDPHTSYMTQEEVSDLLSSINMNFEGIGVAYVPVGDTFMVTRVYRDSPAEKAGVQVGDVMYQVNGELIAGLDSATLQSKIKGTKGTDVNVSFIRGETQVDFTITRDAINALVWGNIIDDSIGYLEISSFGDGLATAVEAYLKDFKEAGISRIIIDLRSNGGGFLGAVEELGSLFFDKGVTIYNEEFTDGTTRNYVVTNSKRSEYPISSMAVLIDEGSASASEVLALALKENINAEIVGVRSYGKGTAQITRQYSDSSALKVTVAKWFSPSGVSIHGTGIEPTEPVYLDDVFYVAFPELAEGISIQYDTVSEQARYVQLALRYLGYHNGRVDGYFDTATKNALINYSQTHDLDSSDIITNDVLLSLYRSITMDWNQHRDERDLQYQKAIEVVSRGR